MSLPEDVQMQDSVGPSVPRSARPQVSGPIPHTRRIPTSVGDPDVDMEENSRALVARPLLTRVENQIRTESMRVQEVSSFDAVVILRLTISTYILRQLETLVRQLQNRVRSLESIVNERNTAICHLLEQVNHLAGYLRGLPEISLALSNLTQNCDNMLKVVNGRVWLGLPDGDIGRSFSSSCRIQ
ncbi:hypothetical protein V5O48_004698 [Marasmius crinis-equi]|uniref:Biogenesis of lysosome-related organelles complex 1 subunit 3 n=1 Tax=Marasmius crinis-equi TaxID=585013 RepID=A0ABR3FPX0_9AGAR